MKAKSNEPKRLQCRVHGSLLDIRRNPGKCALYDDCQYDGRQAVEAYLRAIDEYHNALAESEGFVEVRA